MNRYITLSFFLLFFLGNALYPQQKTLSNNLYTTLSESGIETEIQLLSNSQSESFPFSIIYSSQTTNKYPLHKLCVIIPQNTAFLIKNELIDFIKKLEKDKTPYYVDIILTADDYSPIPEEILPTIPAGTATFIDNLDTNEYTSAIVISDGLSPKLSEKTKIEFSTKGISTPPNFVKRIMDSFGKTQTKYSLNSSLLAFYRLGIINCDEVLSYLLNAQIPAIHFLPSENIFDGIEHFIYNQPPIDNENWDSQYFFINIFNTPIFVTEQVLIFVVLIAIAIGLFLICFSFLFGQTAFSRKKEFLQTSILVPIIILILFASLTLGQIIIKFIIPQYNDYPITSSAFKLMITISLYLIFSRVRFFLKFPQTTYIYGFLLTLVTFINIFIFSLCDLSFFFFFLVAYIIAYLSRATKDSTSLIFAFISIIIIFIPIFFTDFESLKQILSFVNNATVIHNIFIALFLTPFVLMVIRILVLEKLYKNNKLSNYKKLIKQLAILVSIFASLIIFTSVIELIITKTQPNAKNILTITQDDNTDFFETKLSEKVIFEKKEIDLSLQSNSEIIKYEISITSPILIPIYDANFPYDVMTERNTAIFNPDEYPPKNFTLSFSASNKYPITIDILAYVQASKNQIVKTKKQIVVNGN
jgi:hypothetical protein